MTSETFTKDAYKLIIDALWKRQRCFIAGDKMFRKYDSLIKEFENASLS